jgi:hypothetical protein
MNEDLQFVKIQTAENPSLEFAFLISMEGLELQGAFDNFTVEGIHFLLAIGLVCCECRGTIANKPFFLLQLKL